MEGKELRIGNYLVFNSIYGCVTGIYISLDNGLPRLDGTLNKDIGYIEFGYGNVIHPKDIEFLDINNEWLLKLGFLKDSDRDSYYIDIEDGYNKFDLMWFNSSIYLKSRYDMENLHTQMIPHIKYVHQLQNLFFTLSGKELTIKS
ncbi:hypothetical protein HZQ04_15815 [Elizabethkingia anophelis]|nr:hypothetical protein [Elizabethkingia anophelis]